MANGISFFFRGRRLLLVALLTSAVSTAGAQAINQQQAMEAYQNMSPAQRAEALQFLQQRSGGQAAQQAPLPQPQVVRPAKGQQQREQVQAEKAKQVEPENSENTESAQEPLQGSMSAIERRVNRGIGEASLRIESTPRAFEQQLRQFGYDLFNGVPTTFAPATEIPVPSDYIIGPGDTIQVQLFGKENAQYNLVVSRDGTLNFPNFGPISVAGLSFERVSANLSQRVSQQMIGVQASIAMGPLRSIRVFVLGEANRPGSYTVSSLSTMTNALFVSGVIQPVGSLRNVELKRNGQVVTRLDLYDLLMKGDTRADARLQPGDVIFVPPIGPTVGVAGEVRRPAIYELPDTATVGQVLKLAGGLAPSAQLKAAQLERIDRNGGRVLTDIDLSQDSGLNARIADGDVLRIYPVDAKLDNLVLLEGHVQRPGGYQWTKGMRLADLLPSPSDLLPQPDLGYVVIVREIQPTRYIEVYSAHLDAALRAPDSDANPELQPRDRVIVFGLKGDREEVLTPIISQLRMQARYDSPEQVVAVRGHVPFAGEYPLEAGMHVIDLIRAAGGYGQDAYAVDAELTRYQVRDGKREPVTQRVNLRDALAGGDSNIQLKPFDVLQVKRIQAWGSQPTIRLAGEVRFPGEYTIHPGETLPQVLERAGGLTDLGYARGAVFSRQDLREKEAEELYRLRERLQTDLASVSLEQMQQNPQAQQSVAAAKGLAEQLETTEAVGRLVIDLPSLLAGGDQVEVHGGDALYVPRKPQEVTVIGEVHQTTSHLFDPGMDRDDYIYLSGGMTPKADESSIYIVRANGAVIAGSRTRWFGRADRSVEPGDTIVVPLDVDRMRPLALWGTIADIASKLAITAASAKAVGVF